MSHRCSMEKQSEKHFINLGALHPVPCGQEFPSQSKQTTSPACVRFLFQVQGETAGVVPASMSIGNRMQMNVGISMGWEKKSQGDSQGVARDAEGGERPILLADSWGWMSLMIGGRLWMVRIFFTSAGLGFPNCKALGDNLNSLWGVLIVKNI